MIEYENIQKAYKVIDNYLGRQESGDENHREDWTKYRSLNDKAYFVMLFAQFEQLINEKAKNLVTRKKGETSHERAWDLIVTKDFEDKYSLNHKVTLLVGKGSHTAREIGEYYEIRCDLAHGVLVDTLVSISDLAIRVNELADIITRQGDEQ